MKNKKFLNTSEVATLLNINEKKVYVLAQEGVIPATKSTGKWLFPYEELLNFLKYDALKNIKKGLPFTLLEQNILLAAGSDDPILPKIFSEFYKFSSTTLFYSTVGSEQGIGMLKNRIVHFAFSHLYNVEEGSFNIPFLKKFFFSDDYAVINLFYRDIGLVSNFKINDLTELESKKLKFVLRQKGSGIRNITEWFFDTGKLQQNWFDFYTNEVSRHFDVAGLVKENQDFIGITTKNVSQTFNLYFYPLFKEQFDVITLKEYFFSQSFQNFYRFLSENLKEKFSNLNGYDFNSTGKILI